MLAIIATSAVSATAALGLLFALAPAAIGTDVRRGRARGVGLLSIAGFLGVVGATLAGAL